MVVTDASSDCIALLYDTDEGVYASSLLNCDGMTMLKLVIAMDKMKEKIFKREPFLRVMYAMKDEIVGGEIEIDMGALRRAMQEMEEDEDDG
jgi:hypothetical protein